MPKTAASPTTGVSRRHGPIAEGLDYPSRFVGGPMAAEPATAATPPRPFGDLSRSTSRSIARLVVDTWDGGTSTRQQRGQAAGLLLDYLAGYPGLTWQERWEASPVGFS